MGTRQFFDHPATVAGSQIRGIHNVRTPLGIQGNRVVTDGGIDPTSATIASKSPTATFDTLDVAAGLTVVGFAGLSGAVALYKAAMEPTGTKAATSVHTSYSFSSALIVPLRLTVTSRGNAVLSYVVIGFHPTADPVTILATAALSVETALAITKWGVGPMVVNGTTIVEISRIDIDFGIQVEVRPGDAYVWPTAATIVSRMPVIRATTPEIDREGLFTNGVLAINGSGAGVYLRQRAQGSAYYASGSGHISILCARGQVISEGSDGTELTLRIEPAKTVNGAHSIVINTAAALPA